MPSKQDKQPLSRLFRAAPPPPPSLQAQITALDSAAPELLEAIALREGERALRAAAIERLPDGNGLRQLAGIHEPAADPSDIALWARERLAALIDARSLAWADLRADADNTTALLQVAELCSDPALLEQAVASVHDPQQIVRLALEGSSLRLRQLAAQRIDDREDVHRLLKQLQGKDKTVYRILKDKRDAWRAEEHQAAHVEQDIRTIYSSLEALLSRPFDALFTPAVEHFEARWRTFEGEAQPWARERVRVAIERCHAAISAHRLEIEQRAALVAEQSARQAAQAAARLEAESQAAENARRHDEAAAVAAAEAEATRQAEAKARDERRAAEALRLRQIGALVARAHGALRAGHTGPAAGLRRAIDEKLSDAPALPPPLARGLQELDAKLNSLKEWKDYAVSPKRAELIAEMEALIGSTESPKKLAERIKDLRAQWKTISQGVLVDSEADWQRFNHAAATAYEPCRAYFEAQARLRADNVEKRKHVLERLRAFEANQSGEHPDWRAIGQVLYEAPLEWRRGGPVDRGAIRAVEADFDASLARLRGRLDAWHAQNATDKQSLIERARALIDLADGREAVEGAKALQRQWRDIGPARRELEAPLWNEFRAHCDGVFKKREEAYAEHAASLETSKVQAQALCEDIEQLAGQSGTALLEGVKTIPQRQAALEALGELPRADARALYARFERAVNQCETKVRAQRAQDAAQTFENLIEATQRIRAYGWAIANGAAPAEHEALKAEAETVIAGVSQWPKGSAPLLKEAWAKAEAAGNADVGANESALRMLCVRGEIAADRPTEEEDQALRRSYQLQRLVQVMGRREEAASNDWETLALEWAGVGPVSPTVHETLLARFRRCRK